MEKPEEVVEKPEEVVEEVVEEETAVIEEPWMKAEESGEQASDDPAKQVPVGKFVALKKNLRGKISDRDDEIERLKQENLALKTSPPSVPKDLKSPVQEDFEDEQTYRKAVDKYYDERMNETFLKNKRKDEQKSKVVQLQRATSEAVDGHYERAAKLVENSGIKPDIYKQADLTVRSAVETIKPQFGDKIVDQVISILGEGSEKVIYFLGRNQAALNKFQTLLTSDPSGMKAAVYLGSEKQRLTQPKKLTSNAPTPAANAKGDQSGGANATALKRDYDKAHKKRDTQAAYNAKKNAKAMGVDVSKW